MPQNLEKSILATLAYFNIFEFPLTLIEIKKNLFSLEKNSLSENISLGKIIEILNSENLKNKIGEKNGFYFLKPSQKGSDPLKGVGPLVTRQQRYYLADDKFKKVKKIAWLFKLIPYIKMIGVCNSLSYSNASAESDLDLFIVTAQNRIWTTRFLCTILMKILNLRPTDTNSTNKICLSFFVDEDNLNMEKFQIFPDKPDIYLIYWISQLLPLYDQDNIYDDFWQANNWIKQYLQNAEKQIINNRRKVLPKHQEVIPSSYQVDKIEILAKKIQLWLLNDKLRILMNKSTKVVINDGVLKLYSTDNREKYYTQWLDNFRNI
jgi:hypothetical protein